MDVITASNAHDSPPLTPFTDSERDSEPHRSPHLISSSGGALFSEALYFDEKLIRKTARHHGPKTPIIALCVRQCLGEAVVRWGKRIQFRLNNNLQACEAYCQMRVREFEAINARQSWANWRTIPRNLSGHLPNRSITAIDLCSGTGESTAVLAHYCPMGSRVLGLEYNPKFVAAARLRAYANLYGPPVEVTFNAQSVLDPFHDSTGCRIADSCIDLVNASGAIGCHFGREDCAVLAAECARVIRAGGLATLDSGQAGTGADQLTEIFENFGFTVIRHARSCRLDRYRQLCLKKTD